MGGITWRNLALLLNLCPHWVALVRAALGLFCAYHRVGLTSGGVPPLEGSAHALVPGTSSVEDSPPLTLTKEEVDAIREELAGSQSEEEFRLKLEALIRLLISIDPRSKR